MDNGEICVIYRGDAPMVGLHSTLEVEMVGGRIENLYMNGRKLRIVRAEQ